MLKYSKRRRLRAYAQITIVGCIGLLLLLGCFQAIFTFGLSSTENISAVGMQLARSQKIEKNVLQLAYRPKIEHAQAFNELQNIIPIWEQTQDGLLNGNRRLSLFHPRTPELQIQLESTQPDFYAILTAAKKIAQHPDSVPDSVQTQIIVDHERDYFLSMIQVLSLEQQQYRDTVLHLFFVNTGIALTVIFIFAVWFITVWRQSIKDIRYDDEENEDKKKTNKNVTITKVKREGEPS